MRRSGLFLLAALAALRATSVRAQVSEMSLDPLLSFVSCVQDSKPGFCLRERALSYFETWLTGDEDAEAAGSTEAEGDEEEPGSRLNPYWRKMVDQVAERIAGYYGEDDEEEGVEDPNKAKGLVEAEDRQLLSNDTSLDARHKKYKKDKRVKVAMTIILLIIYFIISQLFYMFDKVARTAIFAKLVLAFKIFVMVKLVELKRYLWWVKEEKKEQVHHEVSLHDHHWEEPHHYDHYPAESHYGPSHYDHGPPHDHGHGWGWHRSADPYRAHAPGVLPAPGTPTS